MPLKPTPEAAAATPDPLTDAGPRVERTGDEVVGRIRAMASDITIRAVAPAGSSAVEPAVRAGLDVFSAVERACTRFDPASPLMQANSRSRRWWPVGPLCFEALVAAHRAYSRTGGRFDPRILADLVSLGYDRSLPFASGAVAVEAAAARRRPVPSPWRPRFRGATTEVLLGERPVDLGGIGKGLAVAWASRALGGAAGAHLVEAGGDMYCRGASGDGGPWRVGVEDPEGGDEPVAVLGLVDRAAATSSIRLRRWRAGASAVHHLIDPRTGRPGGGGLLSVTVVGADPADAEVWSKVLFLAGSRGIADQARRRGLAALWVDAHGVARWSLPMDRYVLWRRT